MVNATPKLPIYELLQNWMTKPIETGVNVGSIRASEVDTEGFLSSSNTHLAAKYPIAPPILYQKANACHDACGHKRSR